MLYWVALLGSLVAALLLAASRTHTQRTGRLHRQQQEQTRHHNDQNTEHTPNLCAHDAHAQTEQHRRQEAGRTTGGRVQAEQLTLSTGIRQASQEGAGRRLRRAHEQAQQQGAYPEHARFGEEQQRGSRQDNADQRDNNNRLRAQVVIQVAAQDRASRRDSATGNTEQNHLGSAETERARRKNTAERKNTGQTITEHRRSNQEPQGLRGRHLQPLNGAPQRLVGGEQTALTSRGETLQTQLQET